MGNYSMRPQDIVVLLKIVCYGIKPWKNKDLAQDLYLSTAEISNSLQRSVISGLLDNEKKQVRRLALLEFIIYGLPYAFPDVLAAISRGIPTAHSHPIIKKYIVSDQLYVWPDAEGEMRGLSVTPLYPGAVQAAKKDEELYLLLALIDVMRVGKVREKKYAIDMLNNKLK